MRKKRNPATEGQRNERFEKETQKQIDDGAAEEKAIDAMIKRSIEQHGP